MVTEFTTILRLLEDAYGTVNLLALVKMDDVTEKWSVVLSADWITSENFRDIFSAFASMIRQHVSEEERATIARLGVLTSDNHLATELLRYQTNTRLKDEKVNGNFIHEGLILKSTGPRSESL